MSRNLGRTGIGARFDAPEAPAVDLLEARRAAAFFARVLSTLSDDALFAPSKRAETSRAFIVAELAYNARRLACALADLRGMPDIESIPPADAAVHGATLPPRALRHLYAHSAIHLDVEWRDLSGFMWGEKLEDGRHVRTTPKDRALALRGAVSDLI